MSIWSVKVLNMTHGKYAGNWKFALTVVVVMLAYLWIKAHLRFEVWYS